MLKLVEFIRKMDQGYTEPTLWRAEDESLYVVKSEGAGCQSLVHEWIAASMARQVELPIPSCEIVYVEPRMAMYSANEEAKRLASKPGFGSRFIEPNSPYFGGLGASVPPELRRRVLWFDWLISNGDRIEDNPNVLWLPDCNEFRVIDHNNGFRDPSENTDFFEHHIFRADRGLLAPEEKASLQAAFAHIIGVLPATWSTLPEEWTDSCITTLDWVDSILRRCEREEFWILA